MLTLWGFGHFVPSTCSQKCRLKINSNWDMLWQNDSGSWSRSQKCMLKIDPNFDMLRQNDSGSCYRSSLSEEKSLGLSASFQSWIIIFLRVKPIGPYVRFCARANCRRQGINLRPALTKAEENCAAHRSVCFVRWSDNNVCALRRLSKTALFNIKSQWSLFSALSRVDG